MEGGVNTLEDIKTILSIGVEKVIINTAAVADPSFVHSAVRNLWGVLQL